jgi:hypothetical protein
MGAAPSYIALQDWVLMTSYGLKLSSFPHENMAACIKNKNVENKLTNKTCKSLIISFLDQVW